MSLGEGGKGGEKKEEEGEGIGGVGEGGKRRGRGRPAFWQGFLPPTSLPSFQPSEVKEVSLSFHRLKDPPFLSAGGEGFAHYRRVGKCCLYCLWGGKKSKGSLGETFFSDSESHASFQSLFPLTLTSTRRAGGGGGGGEAIETSAIEDGRFNHGSDQWGRARKGEDEASSCSGAIMNSKIPSPPPNRPILPAEKRVNLGGNCWWSVRLNGRTLFYRRERREEGLFSPSVCHPNQEEEEEVRLASSSESLSSGGRPVLNLFPSNDSHQSSRETI